VRLLPVPTIIVSLTLLVALSSTAIGVREVPTPAVISVGAPLSGAWSREGKEILNGVELATEEINADGGVLGRSIRLEISDTEASPGVASKLARAWAEDETIMANIGGFASSATLAAQRHFDSAGLVQISPAVGHPDFARGSAWSFSMVGVQEGEGRSNARFAYRELGVRNAAIIHRQDAWGSRVAQEFAAEFSSLGGVVAGREYYFEAVPRLRDLVKRLHHMRPELLYVVAGEDEGLEICRNVRSAPWGSVRILSPSKLSSHDFLQAAGGYAEGIFVSTIFAPQNRGSRAEAFQRSYLSRFGEAPGATAALAYDATHLLAEALRRAGRLDRGALREALAGTDGFVGVTGNIRFSSEGNALREYSHLTVKGGRFEPYE
jgi:branched-chain amino acid transport system substrate-binding protein